MENTNTDDVKVSYFENYKYVKDAYLQKVISSIRAGFWSAKIKQIQEGRAKGNGQWQSLKEKLPGFTPCGTFNKNRQLADLNAYSKLIVLDIDSLKPEDVEGLRDTINDVKFTRASFIGPSGLGIKIFIKVNSDLLIHQYAYSQVAEYYQSLLDREIDRTGKDVTRLCFISADDKAYYNADSKTYDIELETVIAGNREKTVTIPKLSQTIKLSQFQKLVELTKNNKQFFKGNRNNFVNLLANNCNRWGLPIEETILQIQNSEFFYDEKKVIYTIQSAYKNVTQHNIFPRKDLLTKNDFSSLQICRFAIDEFINVEDGSYESPFIPDNVYDNLPEILKTGTNLFEDKRQKDIFLTASLGVLSGCFPMISGIYHKNKVFANLYVFVSAPPASGKGSLVYARYYGSLFHENISLTYVTELDTFRPILFIPGNASASAIMGHLQVNDGKGIFFEPEADTLSNTFKNEWGNFSDLLRKGFHHEEFNQTRKMNNEYIEIKEPKLSVVLSGTPQQVQSLVKSLEDGLFSRFLFYSFKSSATWDDVSPKGKKSSYKDYFERIAEKSFKIIQYYNQYSSIKFDLTEGQWQILNSTQKNSLFEVIENQGEDAISLIRRMGLMWYRIAMILSILRSFEKIKEGSEIICEDFDFELATELMAVYKVHILNVYGKMPKQPVSNENPIKIEFYRNLPKSEFTRAEAVEIGSKMNITYSKVDRYLAQFNVKKMLHKSTFGKYKKIED